MIWKSRTDQTVFQLQGERQQWSGVTVEDYQNAQKEITSFMAENPDVKVWGGRCFSFQKNLADKTWGSCPRFKFFIPEDTQITTLEKGVRLSWSHPHHQTSAEDWAHQVDAVQKEIASGVLGKAVLSRCSKATVSGSVTASALVSRLYERFPNCFLFSLDLGEGYTFLGASPERLVAISNNQLETEALAGTRPRGTTSEADEALAEQLLNSPKDVDEHGIVVQHVESQCDALCSTVTKTSPSILKFANVQHLYVGLSGQLKEAVSPLTALETFHPTPAVCGAPTEAAAELIHATEPHDRGWYGGVVGWMSAESAEFAVGIRSALLTPEELISYTGVGVVSESDPEKEWDELNHKAAVFAADEALA